MLQATHQQSCVDGGAPLRAELQRVHEAQRNVGLAVGVRHGEAVIFREDLGFADLEFVAPVDDTTQFGIASVTKAFTGTLMLRLLQRGPARWSRRAARFRQSTVAVTFLLSIATACSAPAPGDRPDEEVRPVPELINRVTNAYPAWSPDGRSIAYMSTADGDFDVYVVRPEAGVRRQLTNTEARDGTPAWSPGGERIAFQSFRDGHSQIYVMNAHGSGQRNISNNRWHDEHPFWSADGDRLLFASNRAATPDAPDNVDIFEMRVDGSDVRRITSTPEVETYPSWSPDESQISVRKIMSDGNWEVVVMRADGSDPRVVAPHPAADGWPVWSPDGRRLVFSSERAGTADLWLFEFETEAVRRLTWDDEADERQPWFSPDGRHVVYARYRWYPGQPFYEASEIMVVEVPY